MENEFSILFQNVLTKEDLISLLAEIDLAESLIFEEKETPLSEKIKGKVSSDFQFFVEKLEREGKNIKEALENLKKYFLSLPEVKLTLAFEPKREFIEKVSQIFKERVILNFKVDPEIVGGAILEAFGKFFDFSLREKLKKILKEELYGGI